MPQKVVHFLPMVHIYSIIRVIVQSLLRVDHLKFTIQKLHAANCE